MHLSSREYEDNKAFRALFRRTDMRARRIHPFRRRGILLVGMPSQFLRVHPPSGQILAHGRNRKPDAKACLDQLARRFVGPQVEGQLELLGASVLNGPHDMGRLSRLQANCANLEYDNSAI